MSAGLPISPYRGLTPFDDSELDVLFFFGRERERDLIDANLMASRLTVLYGETGVGKTSVLRAGVAHHLRSMARKNLESSGEPGLAVVVFQDWRDDPVRALRRAVADAVSDALGGSLRPPEEDDSLAGGLRMWQQVLAGDLYVILDQVEEYFLYHEGESGRGSFAAEFPAVVAAADLRVNFLLAIREDAVAKLDAFRARIPNVLGNYLRLEHLELDAARAAIIEPIAQYNRMLDEDETVEIEPELVDAVLEQVAAGKVDVGQVGRGAVAGADGVVRIETPYLQLVMERLWEYEREAESNVLRLDTLVRLGGAERIVRDHVDGALANLTPADRDIAAGLFDHLVTPSGAKIAHELGDLATYAGITEGELLPVLTELGSERILRSVSANGGNGSRYEIFHDVLAEPVLAWKVAHDARRELDRQRAEAERRRRGLIWLLGLAAAVLLVMAAVTAFALVQRSAARSNAKLAEAGELAARASSQLQTDPQLGLALALRSVRLDPTSQGEEVLRQALIEARGLAILPSGVGVSSVAFSPDGATVLVAGDDGVVRLWRSDGVLEHTLRQKGALTAASFSPGGSLVLTGGQDGTARLWDAKLGRLRATFRHGGPVTSAVFGDGGRYVVTTSMDGTARVWSVATGRPLLVVRHGRPVLSAAMGGDGRRLITVSGDSARRGLRASLFAVPGGRLVRELPARGVTTASFDPTGGRVVTGSLDHTAAIWNANDGTRLHLLAGHEGGITQALFGPRGRVVITTSTDGTTREWNAKTGAPVALLMGHSNAVNGGSFDLDGSHFVTVSSDGTARIWETNTGENDAVLHGHTGPVVAAAFAPDGKTVVTGSTDGTARLWDAGLPTLGVLATEAGPVRSASFSPDGRLVLTTGDDGSARILSAGGAVLHVLRHRGPVIGGTFGPDGSLVFTGGADRALRVWRTDSGALVRVVPGAATGRPAVSPDGRHLAAPAADGSVGIWSTATFRRLRRLTEGAPFTAVSFSPDGRLVATAGEDHTARTWDAGTGALLRTFRGHADAVTDVQFSADGTRLVTAGRDHDARIWNVATGKTGKPLRGHFGAVFGASFSPDGRWVVTAGPVNAGLWDVASGRLLFFLRGHTEPLTSASFSPDGRRILTSSRDGTVRTYSCALCGGIAELLAAADARLDSLGRRLTPAERVRYLGGADASG